MPTLSRLILSHNPKLLTLAIILNLMSAGVSIGVLAFINNRLLGQGVLSWQSLFMFLGLIGGLLLVTFLSQFALTVLGHRFVHGMRSDLVGKMLATPFEQLEKTGSSRILASLSSDIQALNMAFVRLPELIYGVVVVGLASVYLVVLSLPLFVVVLLWTVGVVWASLVFVGRVYHFLDKLRLLGDDLYQDYETVIHGKKELSLNHKRASDVFNHFAIHSDAFRATIIKADTYHLTAVNWSNIMMFAGVGVVLVLAGVYGLADKATATTFALTVLFVQTPLLKAIGAYPVYQSAKVALAKINELNLSKTPFVPTTKSSNDWQTIELQDIAYQYDNGEFSIEHIDFTLNRGDVVFLIGDNGSGKSTLAKVLTGLYHPTAGKILLDGVPIEISNLAEYQDKFGAIFGDFYLFDKILTADDALIETWLDLLNIKQKLVIENYIIKNTELSTGQKKRIALLLAITDNKPILLLDEWAADQDPEYRLVFYQTLIPTLKAMGKTLFVISHDDRFFWAADRLYQMKAGRLMPLEN